MAAALMSSIAIPSMTTLTPGGKAFAATMPGAESIPFFGSVGVFDPLGLTPETKEELLMFREAELAHSRVAMMGALRYLVQSHFAPMFDMGSAPVIRHLGECERLDRRTCRTVPTLMRSTLSDSR